MKRMPKRVHAPPSRAKGSGPDPVDVAVGTKIRFRRCLLDMSQGELGEALGVTFQQIQKYEKDTNRVSASRLQHIADVLHVPVTYFFPEEPNAKFALETEIDELSHFIMSEEGLELSKAFARIGSLSLRKAIVALVTAIGDQQDAP